MTRKQYLWWQKGILYQIYPRSFYDSSGDGIGDLQGIVQKLDYLKELGVKGVWLSPIFPSPMADFGYDVSDYTGIHPIFGSMKDFDLLIKEVHQRNLKLILDFVPNHSSNEHPWFIESKKSKNNPKRDWYIWKDPAKDGGPPNNWQSVFGGSAWEYDETTGQYYYHAFLKEQPDLNWRNKEVQQAMFQAMRFWLDKGVDGFRVDVMWHMIKDEQFRNNPTNPQFSPKQSPYHKYLPVYSTDQPEVHTIVQKMRQVLDEYEERLMIGEIYLPVEKLMAYYGENNTGAHLPFNFQLVVLPWKAREIEAAINKYEGALPRDSWPNWVLGNHDKSRIATRAGEEQARIAAMLLLTLKGTPTMYYGDEIGMTNVEIPPDKIQDPQGINIPGIGLGRDPVRTPMQWDDSPNAGFSSAQPWLPVKQDYKKRNVATEWNDENSILNFYKKLIALRNKEELIQLGQYIPVPATGNLLSYIREHNDHKLLIILNLGPSEEIFNPSWRHWKGTVLLSTSPGKEGKPMEGSMKLQANEGLILDLGRNES